MTCDLSILTFGFSLFLYLLKTKYKSDSAPLTRWRLEGAAVLFGPAGRVQAWVQVEEPEGGGRVREALGAHQAQLQPPADVLLHLRGPGEPRIHGVLELHVAARGQELHWVSTALGLCVCVCGGRSGK